MLRNQVTTLKWCTALEMLEEHVQERIFLAPPQVYELSRIHKLENFDQVRKFAEERQVCRVIVGGRWLTAMFVRRSAPRDGCR